MSAKVVAVTCPTLLLLIAIYAAANKGNASFYVLDETSWSVIAFVLFAGLSLAWTPNAAKSMPKLLYLTLICAGASLAFRALVRWSDRGAVHNAEGVWIGVLIGLIYLIFYLQSGGWIEKSLMPFLGGHLQFGPGEIVRVITPVTLLLGPALLCAISTLRGRIGYGVAALLFVTAAYAAAVSTHDTSRLALVAWAAIFGLSYFSLGLTHRLVQIAWIALWLLAIPAALTAYALDLQHASWLPETAQQRILIWNEFANASLQSPISGHGFNSVRLLELKIPGISDAELTAFWATHPHNVYLQIWFELGAVGAMLLFMVGFTLISQISKLATHQQPFIWSTAIAVMVVVLSSYGLWQHWFMALIAGSVVASAAAIRASMKSTHRSDPWA